MITDKRAVIFVLFESEYFSEYITILFKNFKIEWRIFISSFVLR